MSTKPTKQKQVPAQTNEKVHKQREEAPVITKKPKGAPVEQNQPQFSQKKAQKLPPEPVEQNEMPVKTKSKAKVEGGKKKMEDWLGDVNEAETQQHFEKTLAKKKKGFNTKEGKILLELQKSYKGDDRFDLDQRFGDDLEYTKLPNRVKLAAQSYFQDLDDLAHFHPTTTTRGEDNDDEVKPVDEFDTRKEKESQMSILKDLFPGEKLLTKRRHGANGRGGNDDDEPVKRKHQQQEAVIQRYDPTLKTATQMIVEKSAFPIGNKKYVDARGNGKPLLTISKGVDEAKKKMMMADMKLKQAQQKINRDNVPEVQTLKAKKKDIDYDSWKNILQDDDDGPATLFG